MRISIISFAALTLAGFASADEKPAVPTFNHDIAPILDNSSANPHNPSDPPREVKFGEETTNEMGFAFVSLTLPSPDQVSEFRRGTRAEFIADMLANGVDAEALGPQRAASLTMLLNAFDRNHNGKLDPEERPALVQYLIKRDEKQAK